MATSYPKDRFDTVPTDLARVGAHRGPPKRGQRWWGLVWATGATVVLVVVGLVGIFVLNDKISFDEVLGGSSAAPQATPTPEPTAEPVIDDTVNIQILNGTAVTGLSAAASAALAEQGWTQSISTANASTNDVQETIVYYQDPSQEGVARGLVNSLGVGTVLLSDAFATPSAEGEEPVLRLTAVLGADYAPLTEE